MFKRRLKLYFIDSYYYSSDSSKKLLEILVNKLQSKPSRISETQSQGPPIANKSKQNVSPTVYLQVLGSGAKGAPNALYLFTNNKRYLFNCGEGTLRLAREHKVKLSKLQHIFITTKRWNNLGGLLGLSLALKYIGTPNITLHGPEGLDKLYHVTRRFIKMINLNVTAAPCSPVDQFEDDVMNVKYVLLGPVANSSAPKPVMTPERHKFGAALEKQYNELAEQEKFKCKDIDDIAPTKVKKKFERLLRALQRTSLSSIAYICTLKEPPALHSGECTTADSPSPHTIHRVQKSSGPVFMVLDVSDPSCLRDADFQAHFERESNPPENIPALIVHFTPPHVLHHPTYRRFVRQFGPRPDHVAVNSAGRCLGSGAARLLQRRLNALHSTMFPLLQNSVPEVAEDAADMAGPWEGNQFDSDGEWKLKLSTGNTLTKYNLMPDRRIDRTEEIKMHLQECSQETQEWVSRDLALQQRLAGLAREQNTAQFPRVLFLGTGGSGCSATRNNSAIALHIDEKRSMLLDCGEGTFSQLVHFYGAHNVNAFLRSLTAIYVSHLHSDHHMGLISILQARRLAYEELKEQQYVPVYLLAPEQITPWLQLYDQQFEQISTDYTLVPNHTLESSCGSPALAAAVGVLGLQTCRVEHCEDAFGLAVRVDRAYKLTYSGDTMPCEQLVRIGENSSLLIHEATLDDSLWREARRKRHSTPAQAARVARLMGARCTLLTHFSHRFGRMPRLRDRRLGAAFDFMQVAPRDLPLLPHVYRALRLRFLASEREKRERDRTVNVDTI